MQRVVIITVLGVCSSALAMAPVGSPTAILEGERFGLSFEYGQADADLVFEDAGTEDFDWRTSYAVFSMAFTERWDFYLRLGASQAEAAGFDGDWNVSWGLGTRVTAFKWDAFSWGALVQFTNLVSRFETVDEFLIDDTPLLLNTKEELDVMEYVLATGPAWQLDRLTLYGGLLVRCVTGEFTADAGLAGDQFDLDDHWDVGGYVGGRVTLFRSGTPHGCGLARADLTAEGRFTDDSTGWSVGLLLPFGGEL